MKKVGVVFGGYGTQYVGMGKDLYDEYRIMQEFFEEAYNCQNLNFVKLCFASSDAELAQLNNAYQALFLYNSALVAMLKYMGVTIHGVTGFDVGYYSSFFAAGSLSFPDGLYYLNKFATFYEEYLNEHAFRSIEIQGLKEEDFESALAKHFRKRTPYYHAMTKDTQTNVVTGFKDSIDKLEDYLINKYEQDIKIVQAPLEVGLYSELMKPVYDAVKPYLEKIDAKDAQCSIISPSSQKIHTALEVRSDLIGHMLYPFNYLYILKNLYEYDVIIEISAKGKLAETLKKYYPEKQIISFARKDDIAAIKEFLGDHYKELERVSE